MTNITGVNPLGSGLPDRDVRLKQVVEQLQGVFVEQLFKAMRETVPTDGATSGGPGESMFSSLMDQHLAGEVPTEWKHGIGESLYRQLHPRLSRDSAPTPADMTP